MGFLLPKFINFYFFIRLTIHCSQLTVLRNEIATSHRTLLAMTEQEKIQTPLHPPLLKEEIHFYISDFYSLLMQLFVMDVFPNYTLISKKYSLFLGRTRVKIKNRAA